ncbi:hypothetical protein Patl1_21615 [Pistacia atlantica]|uniref:Uncharacterized protein n=1 Tax=Pistacia atlantica TaxID=434234 RepID=A0ACC1BII1_9ROSI|nr:hypothetical protein Patl1_21615 [Pistacia atlantica]
MAIHVLLKEDMTKGSNFVISPLSFHVVLSLIAVANDEGDNQTAGPTLSFINGVWVAEGFKLKPSFEEVVRGVYSATAKEVDFMNKAHGRKKLMPQELNTETSTFSMARLFVFPS